GPRPHQGPRLRRRPRRARRHAGLARRPARCGADPAHRQAAGAVAADSAQGKNRARRPHGRTEGGEDPEVLEERQPPAAGEEDPGARQPAHRGGRHAEAGEEARHEREEDSRRLRRRQRGASRHASTATSRVFTPYRTVETPCSAANETLPCPARAAAIMGCTANQPRTVQNSAPSTKSMSALSTEPRPAAAARRAPARNTRDRTAAIGTPASASCPN